MSGVEMTGKRLLGASEGETLHQFLTYIRQLHKYVTPKPFFGVEPLDQILQKTLSTQEHLLPLLDEKDLEEQKQIGSRPKDWQTKPTLIEITSSQPMAGKSLLLTHLISVLLLPRSYSGIEIGGRESVVVLVDGDQKFDLVLLHDMMKSRINRAVTEYQSSSDLVDDLVQAPGHPSRERPPHQFMMTEIASLVEGSLERLYLVRPPSLTSLLSTLVDLPRTLLSSEDMARYPVGMIAVDSATSYYWSHRVRMAANTEPSEVLTSLVSILPSTDGIESGNFTDLVKHLKAVSIRFECPVIVTTWDSAAFEVRSNRPRARQRQNEPLPPSENLTPSLNSAFPVLPTLRLVVKKLREADDNGIQDTSGIDIRVGFAPTSRHSGVDRFKVSSHSGFSGEKDGFGFEVGSDGVVVLIEKLEEGLEVQDLPNYSI